MKKFYLSRVAIIILIWVTVLWAIGAVSPAQHARHQKNLESDRQIQERIDLINAKLELQKLQQQNKNQSN